MKEQSRILKQQVLLLFTRDIVALLTPQMFQRLLLV
nr:MAG TPA: hypothetical protein [Bacteriophage sp.]